MYKTTWKRRSQERHIVLISDLLFFAFVYTFVHSRNCTPLFFHHHAQCTRLQRTRTSLHHLSPVHDVIPSTTHSSQRSRGNGRGGFAAIAHHVILISLAQQHAAAAAARMGEGGQRERGRIGREKLRNARRNGGDGVIYKQTGTTQSEATPPTPKQLPKPSFNSSRLVLSPLLPTFTHVFPTLFDGHEAFSRQRI